MNFLAPKILPSTLWQKGRYHVAPDLEATYQRLLLLRNLLVIASGSSSKKDIYGDDTLEGTHDHFAHRFSSSVMRIQNVMLDAQGKFESIPKDVLLSFSSHRVSILDIPSGTGAGGLALISVIHELRLAGIIPMLPLEVSILAGDKSRFALAIYDEQVSQLKDKFKLTGIEINMKTFSWDAVDLVSTSELCALWERTVFQADESFVLVTNFSGAGKKMLDQFKESFRHISARASYKNATLLWIEPGDSGGTSFLTKISELIGPLFKRRNAISHTPPTSEAKGWHDLKKCELPIRSSVHHYTRNQ